MADLHRHFVVEATPADVVAFVADLTNLPTWDSSVRSAELDADLGPAVGRRFAVTVGFYGRALDATYEITHYDASSVVAWSIDGKARGVARVDVRPHEDGSEVDYRLQVAMSGMARLLDRGLGLALEGIGENIEQGLQRHFAR